MQILNDTSILMLADKRITEKSKDSRGRKGQRYEVPGRAHPSEALGMSRE